LAERAEGILTMRSSVEPPDRGLDAAPFDVQTNDVAKPAMLDWFFSAPLQISSY
jgi:hypothetical protein